jgi:hypothetical protein
MTGAVVLEQRRAAAIAAAVEAIGQMGGSTPRLEAAKAEPIGQDLDTLGAIVEALALLDARRETAFTHLVDQVIASQDTEIERLQKRVADLEPPKKGAAKKG